MKEMAGKIIEAREEEIERLKKWRREWYGKKVAAEGGARQ